MLAQRRLAIIDLSPGGAQPMHSADRRYVITFNGEIYNYRDIRSELAAAGRTHAQRFRHRGAARGLRAVGRGGRGRAHHRDVRLRLWDRTHAHAARWRATGSASSRCTTPRSRTACCSPRSSRRSAPSPDWQPTIDDDAVAGYPAPQLHRAAAHDLSRGREAAAGPYPDAAPGRGAGADLLLGLRGRSRSPACRATIRRRTRTRRSSGSMRCCAIPSGCA